MDITKLNADQYRDVLDYILSESYHPEDYFEYKNRILPLLVSNNFFKNQDEYLLRMFLNKLHQDGYIDFIAGERFVVGQQAGEGMTIRRNINGHIFLSNGGYTQERINAVKNESRKDHREKYLLWGTWAVAFGAIALVAWEMYKTFCLEK
jgi:hypothetical protein